jgi:glycosyltransferase involved in cell wall biosynthesis
MRVAITMEPCWHPVPGGTGVATVALARGLAAHPSVVPIGVAARHPGPPPAGWTPPIPVRRLPLPRPALYEAWMRLRRPLVESATGPVDVVHSTTVLVPPATAPVVVTVHDLAWRRPDGGATDRGKRLFERGIHLARRHAALVLCSSTATLDELRADGFPEERLRLVLLGTDLPMAAPSAVEDVRRRHGLPERFVLALGTVEPRKNLPALLAAMRTVPELPLILAGPSGWGPRLGELPQGSRAIGFVDEADKPALLAAAAVLAYPSLWEGFGLPVLEAMTQGTPVVTSAGTSTEEVAGGAAVLVDPRSVGSIADGIRRALVDASFLREAGLRRAAQLTWDRHVEQTVLAYADAVAANSGARG